MTTQCLHIMVLMDAAEILPEDPEFHAEPTKPTTEYHVVQGLRELGHTVSIQGVGADLPEIIEGLTEKQPDLVFNLTEQFGGDRSYDKNITAVLELLDIPFTGTGTMGMIFCRDKRLCKEMLRPHKIRVPSFISFPLNKRIHVPKNLHYPFIIKPALQDGSEGIANSSIVSTPQAMEERVTFVHERFDQPAVAEEYIEGRELYVSVLGNKRLSVLPIRECFFPSEEEEGPSLLTYKVKWDDDYREKWNITFGYAELNSEILKKIQRTCKRACKILHLQDFARVDLRLTPDNRIVILEANPNPDIAYGEEVAEAAEKAGISYEQLLDRIIRSALARYKD